MKPAHLLCAALAALAGCALSPLEVATQGPSITGTLKGNPEKALQCAMRNANYGEGLLPAAVYPGGDKTEMIVRLTHDPVFVWSVWTFTTTAGQTTYEARINPAIEEHGSKHVQAIIKGC